MATCSIPTIPNKDVSGDNLYGPRICNQAFIDWAWKAHGFSKKYWDDGFGYHDVCNKNLPLCRTLSAIWLLNYSADDYWNEQWSNNILHWGRRYVRNQINDLRAKCGDGTALATAFSGFLGIGRRVELYLGFFYSVNVPTRAGVLVHEARHMGGKSHNANFPSWSAYGPGKSGADSSWAITAHGCTAPFTSGGSMLMADVPPRRSDSPRDNAQTSISTTRLQHTRGLRSVKECAQIGRVCIGSINALSAPVYE